MGAYYIWVANSLFRIRASLTRTSESAEISELTASDEQFDVYHMLIDKPHLLKEVKASMDRDIISPWDEDSLLMMYMDKISEMISMIQSEYPERYMELMYRILPYGIASYYEQTVSEERSRQREYDYDIEKNDIQF